jgi:hypothetical protein
MPVTALDVAELLIRCVGACTRERHSNETRVGRELVCKINWRVQNPLRLIES